MAELERRLELPHPAARVFDVVADVGAYAEFLPWLERVELLDATERRIEAILHTASHGLHSHYTTAFELQPADRVMMSLIEGPMHRLDGTWHFTPRGAGTSILRLQLDYEFSNPIYGLLFGHTFRHTIDELLDHVAVRAEALHG